MTSDAERIKQLRQRAGKSAGDVASLAGLGDMAYYDVEAYDDELRTVLSLQQAFEEEIGWELGPFLEGESHALSAYGVDFLQELCGRIGIDWVAALP